MHTKLTLALCLALLSVLTLGCQQQSGKGLNPEEARIHPTLAAWTLLERRPSTFGCETDYQTVALGLHALKRAQLCQTALDRSYQGLVDSKAYDDDFQRLLKAAVHCKQEIRALGYADKVDYPVERIRHSFFLARALSNKALAKQALDRATSSLESYRSDILRALAKLSGSEQQVAREESQVSELLVLCAETRLHHQQPPKAKAALQEALNFGLESVPTLARSALLADQLNLPETRDDCLKRSLAEIRSVPVRSLQAKASMEMSQVETIHRFGRTDSAEKLLKTYTDKEAPIKLEPHEEHMLVNLTSEYMKPILKTIVKTQGEQAALGYIDHVQIRRALRNLAPHLTEKGACLRAYKMYRELDSRSQKFDDKPEDPPYFLVPPLSQHHPEVQSLLEPLITESLTFAKSENRPEQIKILSLIGLALAQHSIPVTEEQVEILQEILKNEPAKSP